MKIKTKIKWIVRLLVLALVIWGVMRAIDKAQRDLAAQQAAIDAQLADIDQRLSTTADGPSRVALLVQREQIAGQQLTFSNVRYGWLAAAGAVYLLALAPAWLYWHRILQRLQQRPHLRESARAYYIGHLGKYIPGKALVVILRATLVTTARTATGPAALAVFVETLTTMAVGACVAAVCLIATQQSTWLVVLSVGLMVAAGLPTYPPLFRRIIRILRVKKVQDLEPLVPQIDGRLLGLGWVLGTVSWCGMGLCLYLVLMGLPTSPPTLQQLPLLIGAVALAAVAGFLSLLPGGIGVRELVVTELLTPTYGAVLGVSSAIVLRLLWLMCELLVSAILYGLPNSNDELSSAPTPIKQ